MVSSRNEKGQLLLDSSSYEFTYEKINPVKSALKSIPLLNIFILDINFALLKLLL